MPKQLSKYDQVSIAGDINLCEMITHDFSAYLKDRGHSIGTQHSYQSAIKHFLRWLRNQPKENGPLNSKKVNEFLKEHLPVCGCPPPVFKQLKTVQAALNQLLLMLGQKRLHTQITKGSAAIETTLEQFDVFQRDVCGLTESTRLNHQRSIRSFLIAFFGTGPIVPQNITSETLVKYVTDKATALKPSSVGQLLSKLRNFLRFLQFKGESNISLIATLPKPPNWSLAPLPPSLNDTDMEKFWASFDTSTSVGKRDYAMARCLADLGLRCNEVTSMKIDDIDCRRGIILLSHNKSRREEQLPLPDITGHAIVNYLLNGRPVTTSRSIFVFHRAPMGKGVANTTVRGVIRRAFFHADLPWTGTHILRHTVATRMVQNGVTLKEVADILRHRNIDTTQIYTKVNLPELKRLAMPWPGRQP
jgi:site-specific recombinase XerD